MKELSIEEKAKAYDKAIEKAKDYYHLGDDKHKMAIDAKAVMEYIFPELKESDDEKIMKRIISALVEWEEKCSFPGDSADMIAWLEKQGEQKPNYCHHEVDLSGCSEEYRKAYYDGWNNCNMQHSQCKSELDDVVKCLINGMKFYYEDNEEATWGTDKWSMPVKHIIEVLEKQGEHKPADKEYTFKAIPRLLGMISPTDRAKSYCQKLIDSLEQEGYSTDAKIVRDCLKQMNGEKVAMATMDEQKPAWSEEDEEMLDKVIKRLHKYSAEDEEYLDKYYWLIELKDRVQHQNTWKPSDEQIKVLEFFIPYVTECSVVLQKSKDTLSSLLSDLRKLREG